MIQHSSELKTDVLESGFARISIYLLKALSTLENFKELPCFHIDHNNLLITLDFIHIWKNPEIIASWSIARSQQLADYISRVIDGLEWSITLNKADLAFEALATLQDIEAALCAAWELCFENILSEELTAPAINPDVYAVLKFQKEAANQAESPRPEPLPIGTQVIITRGKYTGEKAVIRYASFNGYVTWHYHLTNEKHLSTWLPDLDFEVDQAWAIENEESAIFGDGQ